MAGTLAAATAALAALSVSGVLHSYDAFQAPRAISRGSLPVLFIKDVADDTVRIKLADVQPQSPSGSEAVSAYIITQCLLYLPLGAGRSAGAVQQGLVTIVDAWQAVLRANLKLGTTLYRAMTWQTQIKPVVYAGIPYYAATNWIKMQVQY